VILWQKEALRFRQKRNIIFFLIFTYNAIMNIVLWARTALK